MPKKIEQDWSVITDCLGIGLIIILFQGNTLLIEKLGAVLHIVAYFLPVTYMCLVATLMTFFMVMIAP